MNPTNKKRLKAFLKRLKKLRKIVKARSDKFNKYLRSIKD